MISPVIIEKEDGTKDVTVNLPAGRVNIVMHSKRDFQEVVDDLLNKMESDHTVAIAKDALEFWKVRKSQGEAGMPDNPFEESALLSWYLNHPDYETRWQKQDRLKAAREAAQAALQA